jgi:hypothetical protein
MRGRKTRGGKKRGPWKAWKPTALISLVLLALLLFPAPAGTGSAAVPRPELEPDPHGRLPRDPGEAHSLLVDTVPGWPREGGKDFGAAGVEEGLRVAIPYDYVEGTTTHANAQVKVEHIRGGSTLKSITVSTNNYRWFFADFSSTDIQSGDKVRVTDLAGGSPVTVDCTLDGNVDASRERVTGTASGVKVDVYIRIPSTYYRDIPPGAAHGEAVPSGGTFTVNFQDFNIRRGDVAFIYSTDASGHQVMNVARTGGSLVVYPQYDEVMGYYQPGTLLQVKAGSATRQVGTAGDGFFDAWFVDHDIVPGEKVSCVMGSDDRAITVREVSASADPYTNTITGRAPSNRLLRITLDLNRDPVVVETRSTGEGDFSINLDGVFSLEGNEVYNIAWYDGDGDCVVYEFQTFSWYLPEGYTGQGFDEWILVMNPMPYTTKVRVVFQTTTGPEEGPLIYAPPNSRSTVHVNDWTPGREVSTMVTSTEGTRIMAERAMYMYGTIDGKWGAHDSIGILTPSSEWYLPEGATYFGFDEWVLIQNPNDVQVRVQVQFLGPGGVAGELERDIGARSRCTVHVNEFVPNTEVSTRVQCLTLEDGDPLPVFAERAMYMATADGKRGSHDSVGLSTPSAEWYLPEGTTRPGFDEWVLVMNPNDFATVVDAVFLTPGGVGGVHTMTLHPNSRGTIHVNDFIFNDDVSTVITSREGAGIFAERAMYMDTPDGKRGAHDSIGASSTSGFWYLPEGTTRPGFDEWVLIQNPNDEEVTVRVTLLGPTGVAAQIETKMPPNSRHSVHVNDLVQNLDVSTVVETVGENAPGILAERAMYMWTVDYKQGAHDSIGVPLF